MKKFTYKLNWSPYTSQIRAKNKTHAGELIRAEWPKAKGDFFQVY